MLHNNSPRTVAEKQTELESSDRPGDRSRRKCVKDIREWRLLEFGGFGDRVKVVLRSEGFVAGWTKGTDKKLCFIRKEN